MGPTPISHVPRDEPFILSCSAWWTRILYAPRGGRLSVMLRETDPDATSLAP